MSRNLVGIFAVCLAIVCAVSGIAYAAITITGNQVTITPKPDPTIALTVNNATPYVGDTVIFTATLSIAQAGVDIAIKFVNGTQLGSAVTSAAGVATLNYVVVSSASFTVQPYATL